MARVAGVVLAAGQGSRMGQPKALLQTPQGLSYLAAAVGMLIEAGCDPTVAVLGAQADAAAQTLESETGLAGVHLVRNADWRDGMSTSLRAGLQAIVDMSAAETKPGAEPIDAVLIHLVDLPDVGPQVARRTIDAAAKVMNSRAALLRASYTSGPGHPVLIGANHWGSILDSLDGDAGARGYLREHSTTLVDVSDLATGCDVDTPEEQSAFEAQSR